MNDVRLLKTVTIFSDNMMYNPRIPPSKVIGIQLSIMLQDTLPHLPYNIPPPQTECYLRFHWIAREGIFFWGKEETRSESFIWDIQHHHDTCINQCSIDGLVTMSIADFTKRILLHEFACFSHISIKAPKLFYLLWLILIHQNWLRTVNTPKFRTHDILDSNLP